MLATTCHLTSDMKYGIKKLNHRKLKMVDVDDTLLLCFFKIGSHITQSMLGWCTIVPECSNDSKV